MSNNFDLRKFLTENKLTSVAKTTTEATDFSNHYDFEYRKIDGDCYKIDPKTKEKSKVHHSYCKLPNNEETTVSGVNESEGYIEVMGDDFDEAVDQIVFAWEQWKNGPATEPEDIEPARQDVVDYIKSLLK